VSTKLVEVALPLEAISKACKADKDRKVGTIKNVHKWFAPMPTPAWRALLFAALIDDPGSEEGRAEMFKLITRLVPERGGPPDAATLDEARKLILAATGDRPPIVFDPFCGGGSTLVEAQRLGLPAVGSDLNPVAALITRTITELVPRVAGRPPLSGDPSRLGLITGGQLDGFFADCSHYARRVRDQVWHNIRHLYPSPPDGGTVVAWLWTRTVQCGNPACRATAPLVSSFWLSKRKGGETWLEAITRGPGQRVHFEIGHGAGAPTSPGTIKRSGATCLTCSEPIGFQHIRAEGRAGRLDAQPLAVVIDTPKGRIYKAGDGGISIPQVLRPADTPDVALAHNPRDLKMPNYGFCDVADLFTDRQLVALCAFADAVAEVAGWVLADGGNGDYAKAISSVLGLCLGKLSASCSTQGRLEPPSSTSNGGIHPAFSRQALPMVWDFAELNPFSQAAGDWMSQLDSILKGLQSLPKNVQPSTTFQADARIAADRLREPALIATDPPYFAQIGYADLSDFFYIWLRKALLDVHPDLFATVGTPKSAELIADPYRHAGSTATATEYFVSGFTDTFRGLARAAAPDLPILIVYAHRQEASDSGPISSTAWDAMLTAILNAKLRIVGTWPIHATTSNRQIGIGTNALASYIVLVCRPQIEAAKPVDRQSLLAALRAELPKAIRKLQEAAVSSIDLGQATIGPGMATFSRFSRVIEPNGQAMSVRSALELISQVQGEVLDEFVGDLDPETRWAMIWYKDQGFEEGSFDDADKLSKTTVTSVERLVGAGIVSARAGKVRLTGREHLSGEWLPNPDRPTTVWEVTQHLTKVVASSGEQNASKFFRAARPFVDQTRALAYWLSGTAATRNRPKEALDYDALITSWPELVRLASQEEQTSMPGTEA
jgi:putative DNA methylase